MSAPPTEEFPTLGRYQVINRIANGGMAEVFLAKAVGAMGFQRLVAVKLIHANFTRDPEFVNMFIDEARIAMHLHHRNIVQVFDLDSEDDTYFIAMEYVHGVNLYDLYERIASKGRWIEVPMALYMVAEVSKGLHFAHTRSGPDGRPLNIVHRDISPQNVLLSFEGEVKITDFGIATAAERLHQTAAGIVKGKYAYMAPERLEEKPIDARVDVFSVGVLLYELLVGENPFAGTSAVDTIENVLGKKIPTPSERGAPVATRLDEICMKALARNPDDRYPDAQALADALTDYAMELTHARKDMAAGDSAIGNLLKEMFPEKAKSQPGAASPSSFELPGISTRPAERATEEQLVPPDIEDSEDFEAPTLLKMSAVDVSNDPRLLSLDEPSTQQSQDSLALMDTGAGFETPGALAAQDQTTPTELPLNPHDTLEQPLVMPGQNLLAVEDEDEGFAETLPSQNSLDAVSDPALIQTLPPDEPYGSSAPQMPQVGRLPLPVTPLPAYAESQDQLVVPLSNSDLSPAAARPSYGAAEAPERSSKINYLAAGLLLVAVLVVAAALFVVRQGETQLVDVPLTITTLPPGASVVINGVPHSDTTPTNLNVSANQSLLIELSLPGYEHFTKKLMPLEGTAITLEETLLGTSGSLTIRPVPPEATVFVDGKDRGTGTVNVQGLQFGTELPIRVELKGYETHESTVSLKPKAPSQTLPIKLEPKTTGGRRRGPTTRKVILQAPYGTWANVYYKGRRLGTTPTEATLPFGKIDVQVRNDEAKINKTIRIQVSKRGNGRIELRF